MKKRDLLKRIEQLEERLVFAESRLAMLEAKQPYWYVYPNTSPTIDPFPQTPIVTTTSECFVTSGIQDTKTGLYQ